jgi:hypothetical protein
MKILLFLSLFLLMWGCTSKTGTDKPQDTTRVDSTARIASTDSYPQDNGTAYRFILETADFSALVLPASSASTDSTEDSEIAFYLNTIQVANVQSQSTLTYPPDMDICDQYIWYQVLLDDQQTGWITGDRLVQKAGAPTWQDRFEYDGKTYNAGFLRPATMGASNARGLTGCNDYALLYFLDEAGKTIHFLKGEAAILEAITGSYNNWFCLLSGEGGGGTITSLEAGTGQHEVVRLHLRYCYQEGGGQAILHIEERDGIFVVASMERLEETN